MILEVAIPYQSGNLMQRYKILFFTIEESVAIPYQSGNPMQLEEALEWQRRPECRNPLSIGEFVATLSPSLQMNLWSYESQSPINRGIRCNLHSYTYTQKEISSQSPINRGIRCNSWNPQWPIRVVTVAIPYQSGNSMQRTKGGAKVLVKKVAIPYQSGNSMQRSAQYT